ncbi:MAG: hypothetical protein MMC33_008281 [Icmadophila ericetorum]|nr:hypothetical protein [Icmadophila ericetorum]
MKRLREGSLSPPMVKKRVESTTTSMNRKAVTNFFTPASKKEPERIAWRVVDNSLLVGKYDPEVVKGRGNQGLGIRRRKIAAFDFDSTLIKTSSGNVFGKNAADWKWWDAAVPGVLRQLHADGYLLVIVSNQGGISLRSDPKTIKSDTKRLQDFKTKVSVVFSQFEFPISLYAATSRDKYRKPRSGMWSALLEDFDLDDGDGPDLPKSLFVGDAAGRLARGSIKADFSSSDRDIAANIGIAFHTPEEFFLNESAQPFTRTFEPAAYLCSAITKETAPLVPFDKKYPLDIVMFCGSPASGKSTFYWEKLEPLGYTRINQDTLKTRDRCLKKAEEELSIGTSVTIDNTNADPETRTVWVALARKFAIPIRCVYFTSPPKLCEHNDTVRALHSGLFNPEKRSILPHSAFSSFASRFREPQLIEGFDEIIRLDFKFQGNEEQRKIWGKYWI